MKIVHNRHEIQKGKACLAIGVFDGVHLGHQQVIRQTVSDAEQLEARSVVITFDCHPNTIVAPNRVPPLISSIAQKLQAIASLGAQETFLIHFDHALSQQSPEHFIHTLAQDFGSLLSICVGNNFTFGHQRKGNVDLLKSLGNQLHFTVRGLPAVSLDGEVVSSTRIRDAIAAGRFDAANQMLGRTYTLSAQVIHGDQLGRQLGFPTANLDTSYLALPPTGVYAAHARIDQQALRAVLNIGHRPTLNQPTPTLRVEAHLLDFNHDLYGKELKITFVAKLRDEKKFASLPQLKEQIQADILAATKIFQGS